MTDDLNSALDYFARAPVPVSLSDMEAEVSTRIDAILVARSAAPSLGLGLAAAALVLLIGIASTGPSHKFDETHNVTLSVFSPHAALIPSTLLVAR